MFVSRRMKDAIEKAEEADVVSDAESTDDEVIHVTEARPAGEKWDCESILCAFKYIRWLNHPLSFQPSLLDVVATYSNLYNHPKKISEPSLKPKVKRPQLYMVLQ